MLVYTVSGATMMTTYGYQHSSTISRLSLLLVMSSYGTPDWSVFTAFRRVTIYRPIV
jgi:hypothetical protein